VISTYRVQIRPGFDLDATAEIVDYLHDLGVSHLYAAPLLTAVAGSEHGYDVVDPTRVNPALGGPNALDRLVVTLRATAMGLVADIVPNHVGVAAPEQNPAWWSVLRDGQTSPYARWFDIDWSRGPILIPVLPDAAAARDIAVDGDALVYAGHRYPIAPGTEGGVDETHERQHYRLVDWRRGDRDLTYRRFFAITDLAGVRVENPAVFAETHQEVLRWIRGGLVDGLRVDHPDGLRDPGRYLRRLRKLAPDVWLVVEKILQPGETLPSDWPVDGTTGYDALRDVCGVFIDAAAVDAFPADTPYAEVTLAAKRAVATGPLAAELDRLTRLVTATRHAATETHDSAPHDEPSHEPPDADRGRTADVREALAEIAAHLPTYRTYLPDGHDVLDGAITAARVAIEADGTGSGVPADVARLLRDPDSELSQRFAQFTGAVMAKGVEDTAFYRWNRFVALNEVGGDPDRFGLPVDAFHTAMALRRERGMTTLSTHDTKRGEDVRARLAVLSELPGPWHAAVEAWSTAAPLGDDALAELLWQSAVGAWPIERERLRAYALKAAREAGTSTSWTRPSADFEATLRTVVDRMYDDAAIRDSITAFAKRIEGYGWSNALGQKLVQLTMPGVPDTYQGTELWDNSLVDPDNRRPVDFAVRQDMLRHIDSGALPPVDATGAAKMLVTSRALRLRRGRPELFTGYRPLGAGLRHVLAYDRGGAITVATRLPATLAAYGGFGSAELDLPDGDWHDVLTGRPASRALAGLLDAYPVALLVRS
jgi:(1->4)-alpha-D-glucan 1-alpha-D-glucosylmutase